MPFEIKWRAPEFRYRHKNVAWYMFAMLAGVAIVGVAVWQRNFLLAVFVVIAEILFLFWGNKEPETVDVTLNEKGVSIGTGKFYPFADLQNFGVGEAGDEWVIVVFTFKQTLKPATQVMVPRGPIEEVAKVLGGAIERVEVKETLTSAFERFFKF